MSRLHLDIYCAFDGGKIISDIIGKLSNKYGTIKEKS